MNCKRELRLPLDKAVLSELHAGDACTLTGSLYTLRDAGHLRLLEELDSADADERSLRQSAKAFARKP